MSMGGSQNQTSTVKISQYLQDASKQNIARANQVADIGFTPWIGPDVAAFSPMQQASFANTGQAANAFGVAGGGMSGMEGMPQAQTFDNGVAGYSSYPMYEQARQELSRVNPDQYAAIEGMFNQLSNQPAGLSKGGATAQQPAGSYGGGGSDRDYSRPYSGGTGGYTSFTDMFDGGGAGQSGSTFVGPLSGISNAIASPYRSDKEQPSSSVGTKYNKDGKITTKTAPKYI